MPGVDTGISLYRISFNAWTVATHFEKMTHFEKCFQSALNLGPNQRKLTHLKINKLYLLVVVFASKIIGEALKSNDCIDKYISIIPF